MSRHACFLQPPPPQHSIPSLLCHHCPNRNLISLCEVCYYSVSDQDGGDGVQTSGPGAGRWWRGCVLSWPGAGADWGLAPGSGVLVAHWAASLHNVQYHHNISGHHFIITSSKSGNHCIFTIRQRHKFRHFWNHLPPFFPSLSSLQSR